MEIQKNKHNRYDIANINDAIPGKKYKGIAGYRCPFIGWLLNKLGFAIALKDSHNKTFYLNKKSAIHWLNRHGTQLSDKTAKSKIFFHIKELANAFILGELGFPKEIAGHICHFLLPADLAHLGQVNRGLNAAGKQALYDPKEWAYNLNHFLEQAKKALAAIQPVLQAGHPSALMLTILPPNLKKALNEEVKQRRAALEPLKKYIEGLINHGLLEPQAFNLLSKEDKKALLEAFKTANIYFTLWYHNLNWLPRMEELIAQLTAEVG